MKRAVHTPFLPFVCWLVLFFAQSAQSQDFMMQGWYWDYPKTCNGSNWADTLQTRANELGSAGFTYAWLPPLSRASFGSCSNGYDPKDLYDLGEYGLGPTGFGSKADVDAVIAALNANGVASVADVVYNHRDGGSPENNPAVASYITTHYNASKNPFPSDRFRCVLPLGGTSGNGAGDYYIKISSKTASNKFFNAPYKIYAETSLVGYQNQPDQNEAEPNGGGDCGQGFNDIGLGINTLANVDAPANSGDCRTDEFKLTLTAADFNAAGDELVLYLNNSNGFYSDHRIYGIWNASAAADVVGQLNYQTFTDFTNLPSGQGGMNFENFKPNSTNASTNFLNGDWDSMLFFYDYDQNQTDTQNKLRDWSSWLWNSVGIRGFRMDAVKHFDPAFVGNLMNQLNAQGINPGMVVGEFFDSNPLVLNDWVNSVTASMNANARQQIKMRVFDFHLRESLKNACDLFGYDARNVFNSGLYHAANLDPFNIVTFVNNHDFRGPGEPVQNDPMLAYAYMLTNNQIGLPTVFYPDYYGIGIPNAPANPLKADIDELMQIHQQYIYQANRIEYLNRLGSSYSSSYQSGFPNTTLFYQLSNGIGGVEVFVAINFAGEPLVMDHQIRMDNLNGTDVLQELTGNGINSSTTITSSNQVHIEVPARSYTVWIQSAAPLPLELSNFTATRKNTYVELNWLTASEENVSGFAIERSKDGKMFKKIGWQQANNQGNSTQTYQYEDHDLSQQTGPIYYRLKLLDQDGQYSYSSIKVVQLEQEETAIIVSPNPLTQQAVVKLGSSLLKQDIQIQLYHSSGQLLRTQQLPAPHSAQGISLTLEGYPPGTYLLKVANSTTTHVQKILKM